MAGKKDIVEQALKLVMGGSDDAAKRVYNIQKSDPFPVDYIEPGSLRYKYEHPDTSSFMEIITRPKGARGASVIGLEVPEEYRGTGIGKALQERVLQDFPSLMGQVSSKAAAVNAYNAGRRPLSNPNATIEDVFKMIDEDSSVNLATPKNTGGSVREGYAGKGRVVGDVVDQALKFVMGDSDEALRRYMQRSFVRDSEGNPIRLYHATPKSFDVFNVDPEGDSGPAIFLSPYANQQPAAHNVGGGEGVFREGTNVMPVYARVNSPLVIDTPDMLGWARSVYGSEFPHFVNKDARESLIKDGYDGVVFGGYKPKEYAEGVDVGQQPHGDEEVVVLHPNQVKSAISNEGTYDPNDPRINKDGGGEVDPYADEVARAKALIAEKQYDDQPWSEWAGDAVGNALNTAKAILPTALGGRGEVGISDMARGAYEGAKDAVTFPGDVISGKQPLYDESGRPLESAVGRSLNTIGAVGGASSLVPVPDNSLRVFGGIKSKTADKNALTKAQIMESRGASPEDIHGSTGWYRGTDEQWRYEIPDIGSTVDPSKFQLDLSKATIPSPKKAALGDYLNHPDFFNAYPEFKNMEVRTHRGGGNWGYYMPRYDRGTINPGFNDPYISLNMDFMESSPAQQRSTLLHEIQHAIQQKEGFMNGANPNSIAPDTIPDPRVKIYEDAVANDPDFQEWRLFEKSDEFQNQIREANKFYKQEYDPRFKALNMRDDAGEDTYGEWAKLSDEYEKKVHEMFPLMKRRAELGQSLTRRGIPLSKPMRQFLTPQEAYERTAGEVESRNVQKRMDMPVEELKYKFPDTTEDIQKREQLVDWNDTSWRKGYSGRGRVIGDVVDQALKLVMGSGDDAAKTAFSNTRLKTPQGDPMRLYHMTPKDIFEFRASPENRSGPAVFLSPYPDYQPAYHQAAELNDLGKFTSTFKEGANVMPVYADVRNPLVLDHPRKIKEAAAKYQGGDLKFPRIISPEARSALEAEGYDGIVFGGDNPIPYGDRAMDARLGHQEARDEEFLVFDPKRIKSAVSNTGEYDFENPDITKAEGGSVREGYAGKGRVAKQAAEEATTLAKRILGAEPEVRTIKGAELLKKTEGLSEDPFGFSKFSKPLSEMEYTVKMLPREEYKSLDPYDLVKQNATIAGHISDRTAAGREIANIGGTDLTSPLRQRGGADYQRTTLNAWANRQGAAKGLNRKLNEAAGYKWDKGKKEFVPQAGNPDVGNPVYTTPVFMGASSANSSHMVGVPLIRMIPNLPISKGDKLAFDAMMSERFPGWPGIENTAEAEKFMYSGKIPGSAISRFVKYASGKKWKGAGFPDTSEIMFSAMDPRLVGVPQGSTGMGFKEFNPGRTPIIKSNDYHPDYPSAIPGREYAGGFKYQVPNSIMLPDWWRSLKPELRLPENATKAQHTLMTQVPTQKATPEWADRILEHWEKNPKPWGYAEGGSVEGEDGWFDSAMTLARNAADKATFGTAKYAAAGADYLTDAVLDAVGYENDADFDRALAEQEYAMKEGEEKNPAAAGAGDVLGYVAPYLAIGPAEGALSTLGYLSDYGSKVGKTGSLFARALGYADGGEVDDDIYHAVRLSRDIGGATNENPQVMMTDANGIQYDATGKVVQPVEGPDKSSSMAQPQAEPENINKMFNVAPQNYYSDVQPLIDYAVTPIDREGMPSEPDLVDVMKVATQVAAEGQPQPDSRGEANWSRRREEAVNNLYGADPERPNSPSSSGAWIANRVMDFSPTALGEIAHDFPYEAVRTGDYGSAAAEAGLNALMTAPVIGGVARGVKKGYDYLKKSPTITSGIAGSAGLTAGSDEAEAGPARWFSKAMEVAGALPMEKMTGQQALAMLRKNVSPEELRWTGTEKFLGSRPQVSKGELLEHLKNNRLQLNEIKLESGKVGSRDKVVADPDLQEKYRPEFDRVKGEYDALNARMKASEDYNEIKALQEASSAKYREIHDITNKMIDEQIERMGGLGRPPKYEQYSTPGGEGYRESLYSFGDPNPFNVVERNGKWLIVDGSGNPQLNASGGERWYYDKWDAESAAKSLYRGSGMYTSPHWDDPNVLWHTRSQTLAYDPPGANRPYRVHNVDETQSDPGQAGRRRGFYDPEKAKEADGYRAERVRLENELTKRSNEIRDGREAELIPFHKEDAMKREELRNQYRNGQIPMSEYNRALDTLDTEYFEKTADIRAKFGLEDRALDEVRKKIEEFNNLYRETMPPRDGIPKMPFVTSTEAWTDRSIKQELDRALDSGADYFSWSPGKVHVDRYNLRNHISEVQYNPLDKNFVALSSKDGTPVMDRSINDPNEIDEIIGKELADKLREGAKKHEADVRSKYRVERNFEDDYLILDKNNNIVRDNNNVELYDTSENRAYDKLESVIQEELRENPFTLGGIDLETGGEGMMGYYDKVYLKRVQKVVEKATGVKVPLEEIEVQTGNGPRKQLGIKLTDEMREKARFSDFNRGGTVTAPSSYGNDDPAVSRAIALTREY